MSCHVVLVDGTSRWHWFYPVSWLLKRSTNSEWSHCALMIDGLVYEADAGGVASYEYRGYRQKWRTRLLAIRGLTPEAEQKIHTWCRASLGTPYDYGKLLGMFFQVTCGWVLPRILLDRRDWFTCYEYLFEALLQGDVRLEKDQASGVPEDLLHDPRLEATIQVLGGDAR